MNDKEVNEAVTCAIRHIGTGIYSSGKIRGYLATKGFDESVCVATVDHLISTGYIDDRRASRKVLTVRTGRKQESRNYIFQRLLEAGINNDIADEIASGLPSDSDTCESLFEATYLGVSDADYSEMQEEFLKLAGLRGYSIESALKAYRNFLDSHS